MPKISVVIPLYNKENFIKKTLDSVLQQTFTDFEVIIVNDCSTDNSDKIILEYKDERIKKVEHKTNKGLSAARNTGILNSNSDYIAFLDADDIWEPEYLAVINDLIQNFPEANAYATNYFEDINGKKYKPYNSSLFLSEDYSGTLDFFEMNLQKVLFVPSSFCVKKSTFDTIGLYDENINFCEDVDLNIRLNLHFQIAFSNLRLCNYLVFSENQIMHGTISNKVFPNYSRYEKENPNNKALKKYLDFERFLVCKKLKLENNSSLFQKYYNEIDQNNLNIKQKLILHSPRFILVLLIQIKNKLSRIGLQLTSYSSISRID